MAVRITRTLARVAIAASVCLAVVVAVVGWVVIGRNQAPAAPTGPLLIDLTPGMGPYHPPELINLPGNVARSPYEATTYANLGEQGREVVLRIRENDGTVDEFRMPARLIQFTIDSSGYLTRIAVIDDRPMNTEDGLRAVRQLVGDHLPMVEEQIEQWLVDRQKSRTRSFALISSTFHPSTGWEDEVYVSAGLQWHPTPGGGYVYIYGVQANWGPKVRLNLGEPLDEIMSRYRRGAE